jgi:hypothetical protein
MIKKNYSISSFFYIFLFEYIIDSFFTWFGNLFFVYSIYIFIKYR